MKQEYNIKYLVTVAKSSNNFEAICQSACEIILLNPEYDEEQVVVSTFIEHGLY